MSPLSRDVIARCNSHGHEVDNAGDENEELIVKQKYEVEQIINKIVGESVSVKFVILAILMVLPNITGPLLVEIPIFTGFIPYEKWICLSDKCSALRALYTGEPKEFYSQTTICKNSLKPDIDFAWSTNRTSYAMDWGLICSKENKGTNLMSFFFVGGFVGVITGTFIFDRAGRKRVTLIAIMLAFVATLANAFVSSYSAMLPLRVMQGFASFLVQTGVQVMAMEFTPTKFRNVASILVLFCWSIGKAMCIGMSYILFNWHHIFFGTSVAILLTAFPIIFCPESPRFQLLKGREDEAKHTFKRIARIFGSPIVIDDIEIEYSDYKKNYWNQIKDFKNYPAMAKNSVLLLLCYMMLSANTYSMAYGWGKLGANLHVTQALCTVGNALVVVTGYQYLITERLGRRKALVVNISLLTVFSVLAIPKVSLSSTWTLTQVMCPYPHN